MTEKLLEEMIKMNKLLAISATKGMDNNEKIDILIRAGYKYKEIADLIDVSENAVKLTAFRKRKKGK